MLVVWSEGAEAKLEVVVDKSTQQMQVVIDGTVRHVWNVSTGRDRHTTPNGIYAPERMARNWRSSAYYRSPMPYSIFFHNGYAIHGSYAISQLGGPASHGCVRLHPFHAAMLFALVEREGPENTTIVVRGDDPPRSPAMAGRDMDQLVGSVVEEPEHLGGAPGSPDPAGRPRPAGREVALVDRRDDPAEARLPRLPPSRQIEPDGAIAGRGRLSAAEPARPPHHVAAERAVARSNPDLDAPPQGEQPRSGYKLLPKSYWYGAAWRWR
ncbi:MAG: L,D-transpeptidase family protein [Xanthobacteraceae bacterium]|jgi:hypothetical protein